MASTKLSSILCLASLACTALSAPTGARAPGCPPSGPEVPVQLNVLQSQQPTDGLPSNSNATLQFIGLGVGIQNYSCSSTTAAPTSIGAIATLFDATGFLASCDNPSSSKLPSAYLNHYQKGHCQASPDLSDDCQEKANYLNLPVLGHHYFIDVNGAGVPFFDIYAGEALSAQKTGDVKAPAGSPAGSGGFGAVDWLFLPSDGSSRTNGLAEVYRINTAGGEPDPNGCASGESVLSYKYSAEYWFYQ